MEGGSINVGMETYPAWIPIHATLMCLAIMNQAWQVGDKPKTTLFCESWPQDGCMSRWKRETWLKIGKMKTVNYQLDTVESHLGRDSQ